MICAHFLGILYITKFVLGNVWNLKTIEQTTVSSCYFLGILYITKFISGKVWNKKITEQTAVANC